MKQLLIVGAILGLLSSTAYAAKAKATGESPRASDCKKYAQPPRGNGNFDC